MKEQYHNFYYQNKLIFSMSKEESVNAFPVLLIIEVMTAIPEELIFIGDKFQVLSYTMNIKTEYEIATIV